MNFDLFYTKFLSNQQLIVDATMMIVNPIMVVLCIQLPKCHDNDDIFIHIQQLTKVCVTNGENTNDHKLQYFPNSLRGKTIDWFAMYETIHPTVT